MRVRVRGCGGGDVSFVVEGEGVVELGIPWGGRRNVGFVEEVVGGMFGLDIRDQGRYSGVEVSARRAQMGREVLEGEEPGG